MNLFGGLQRVGKALMLPVAVMPAASLLLRFGQPDLLNIPAVAEAGNAIIGNLPLLFAVGVGVGLAGDSGVAGLSALVAYQVLTRTAQTLNKEIDMGVLAGILAGALAASLYHRFKDTRLPPYLGFFGGRRSVPIVTAVVAMVLGLVFGFIWPPIQKGIEAVGHWILGAGVFGVGIFGVLNRLLIPFGLHHILNTMVWFVFGDFTKADGAVVHGDMARFLAGDPSAGIFMAGWFPVMMFGLVGAALAMIHEARPERRKAVAGILLSGALTSFLTGITEPLEFAFMFVSPLLYVFHAVLSGVSLAVTTALGIRHGFGFSAGLIDYLLNFRLATRPLLIIPLGLAFLAVYYVTFRALIRALDLATPGREADEATPVAG